MTDGDRVAVVNDRLSDVSNRCDPGTRLIRSDDCNGSYPGHRDGVMNVAFRCTPDFTVCPIKRCLIVTYYVATDTPDAAYWSAQIECETITTLVQSLVQRRIPMFFLLNQRLNRSGFDSHHPLQTLKLFGIPPKL